MCVRPCFAALHGLPPEVLKIILKYLKVESKKNLRRVCKFLYQNIGLCEEWWLRGISPERLRLFADEVVTIKGVGIVHLSGESSAVDDSLEHLVLNHPELHSVRIARSSCTDNVLQALMSNPNMLAIQLSNSNITGENLQLEPGVTLDLEILDLEGCRNLSGKGLLENILERTAGEKLQELNLSGCTNLSLEGLGGVTTNSFTNIESLNLMGCANLTDEFRVEFLTSSGGSLKRLNLSRTNITLSEFASIATSFPHLIELVLYECRNVTDRGLISFLNKTGGNLKKLNLSRTTITLSKVCLLTASLRYLEELDMSPCYYITDEGIISLLNKTGENLKKLNLSVTYINLSEVDALTVTFPVLKVLDLSYCRNITETGIISLLSKTGPGLTLRLIGTIISVDQIKAQFPTIKVMK